MIEHVTYALVGSYDVYVSAWFGNGHSGSIAIPHANWDQQIHPHLPVRLGRPEDLRDQTLTVSATAMQTNLMAEGILTIELHQVPLSDGPRVNIVQFSFPFLFKDEISRLDISLSLF